MAKVLQQIADFSANPVFDRALTGSAFGRFSIAPVYTPPPGDISVAGMADFCYVLGFCRSDGGYRCGWFLTFFDGEMLLIL